MHDDKVYREGTLVSYHSQCSRISTNAIFRSFAKPPKAVQTVCECIVVMRGVREVSWKSAKGMMSEANFLRSLTEMDVDNINQKQTQAVKGK